jgi:hypothetical protein
MKIDLTKLRRIDPLKIGAPFTKMLRDADLFITEFSWCCGIKNAYLGFGVADLIAVFLCELDRTSPKVDEWLWVVVGDVPPAYLVLDRTENPADALEVYITEMQKWVDAVRQGRAVVDLIPVNTPPELEYADMLSSRLDALRAYLAELRRENISPR